ncbi:hypothetical protein DSO57_1019354 [Entomophthora muscae]|uniref:Uncharacterized protein n=1 Tax=Entomophthora muscae TaxID=34485 RepID=A0ACC2T3V4_9FUNG|nr:hypothetical protein DSO57_1019354 [Entomophthora muscae]
MTKPTILSPPTSDAAGQSSQFLGVVYLELTGLIDSALPVAGPWDVSGKALSCLVKLSPIIWWAMPLLASTPPSLAGASQYSWYTETSPKTPHRKKSSSESSPKKIPSHSTGEDESDGAVTSHSFYTSIVTVSSIMLGIIWTSRKDQKARTPLITLTDLTDLNQTVD